MSLRNSGIASVQSCQGATYGKPTCETGEFIAANRYSAGMRQVLADERIQMGWLPQFLKPQNPKQVIERAGTPTGTEHFIKSGAPSGTE
jgi:hypothetical protein